MDTCLEPRGEIWAGDALSHPHLDHTVMEAMNMDEADQKMALNKKTPRATSNEYLRDRSSINFSQRKPKGAREMEKESRDSGSKKESFKK